MSRCEGRDEVGRAPIRFAGPLALSCALAACFADNYVPEVSAGTDVGSSGATGGTTDGAMSAGCTGGTTGAAAGCGDGIVDPSEQCDDGNTDDGDGCSATCTLEGTRSLYVFATLGKVNGNIGPIENADAKCQSEATQHGLPGTYLAWLSTANTSPRQRFAAHELPYVLPGAMEPAEKTP